MAVRDQIVEQSPQPPETICRLLEEEWGLTKLATKMERGLASKLIQDFQC